MVGAPPQGVFTRLVPPEEQNGQMAHSPVGTLYWPRVQICLGTESSSEGRDFSLGIAVERELVLQFASLPSRLCRAATIEAGIL
jgi:hypothetical protein